MSTTAPPRVSTAAKAGKSRSLLRPLLIGLALAAAAYALGQTMASDAGDPAKPEKGVLVLLEPAVA